MTAHVAEARENSGRVLVWLAPACRTSVAAFSAAARLASAFSAFVETIAIGGEPLGDTTGLPLGWVALDTARSNDARRSGIVFSQATLMLRRQQRLVAEAGARAGISVRHSHTNGDAIDQIDDMCRQHGPWNIVVLGRAPGAVLGQTVSSILANVSGATGVLVAGRNATQKHSTQNHHKQQTEDVLVAIEDVERVPSFLRAAERLRRGKGQIRLLLVSESRGQLASLEEAARLAVAGREGFSFEPPSMSLSSEDAVNQTLVKAHVAFVIARFGGACLPSGRGFERTMALSGSPFLLVR